MKFKSIRNRIVVNYMIVFLITLFIMNVIIYLLSAGFIIKGKKDILKTTTDYVSSSLENEHKKHIVISRASIEEEIEEIRSKNSNLYIMISQSNQKSVGYLPIEIPDDIRGLPNYTIDGENIEEYFYASEIYSYNGNDFLIELVLVADYQDYLKVLVRILFIVEILGLGISLIAGYKTASSVINPIKEISDMTERITSESLQERLPLGATKDEIYRLSELINQMLEGLEESFEGQRRFISNVSHELRTPVAVMKGYIDIYRKMGETHPELAEEAIEAIEIENDNIKRLIDKLLFLARGDLEGFQLEKTNIESFDLLDRVRKGYDTVAGREGIYLNIQDKVNINCDINMITQMMRAFVDNAFKYAGESGIELGSYLDNGKSILYVKDFGRGMRPDEKEKVFERFYRADEARNRDCGSMGLGLSIVAKLANIHGCEIGLDSEVGKGSVFKIIFPHKGV